MALTGPHARSCTLDSAFVSWHLPGEKKGLKASGLLVATSYTRTVTQNSAHNADTVLPLSFR